MAWIESHQDLLNHPKLFKLSSITGWSINETIGILHRLWWWALSYAEDGDLSKYESAEVALALGIDPGKNDPKEFFNTLIGCGFMRKDKKIHDWLDYAGRYLKGKYRTSNPSKLLEIERKYKGKKRRTKDRLKTDESSPKDGQPTYPNLPKPTYLPTSDEVRLSELLLSFILERDPLHKKPDIQKWAGEIHKIIRIDKRDPSDIEAVIRWCQADDFWKDNIFSTDKLRKQYGQLKLKMGVGDGNGVERKRRQEEAHKLIKEEIQRIGLDINNPKTIRNPHIARLCSLKNQYVDGKITKEQWKGQVEKITGITQQSPR
jgi:hypothetical protein